MTAERLSDGSTEMRVETASADETQDLAARLGRQLVGGEVLALEGDLGAGKTCFVRGLAQGLDLAPDVIYSPSFTLVAEHEGRVGLNHVDLFRLGQPVEEADVEEIGLRAYLGSPGVTAVEWWDHLGPLSAALGPPTLWIKLRDAGEARRQIRLRPGDRRGEEILSRLRQDG